MTETQVSVIIPTLNEEQNIEPLLTQLMGRPGVEIIVSDGGSTDKTLHICGAYPVKIVSGPPGRGRQLNAGFAAATGDILFFLHADTRIEPRVIDDIRNAVEAGAKWGCCTVCFDEDTLFFRLVAAASRLRAAFFSSCYGDQGIFCERGLFITVGGFRDIPIMEDVCLSRCLRRHCPARIISGRVITGSRRFRQGGLFKTIFRMQALKILFALGVSAERLASRYKPVSGGQL